MADSHPCDTSGKSVFPETMKAFGYRRPTKELLRIGKLSGKKPQNSASVSANCNSGNGNQQLDVFRKSKSANSKPTEM